MFRSFKHQINRFHYLGKFGIQWCLKGGIVYIYSIYLSYICSFLYKVSSEIEIKTMNCLIYFLFRETKASCIKTLDSFWAEQLKSQRGRSETRESLLLPIKVLLWLLYITTYTKLDLRYCFSDQTFFFHPHREVGDGWAIAHHILADHSTQGRLQGTLDFDSFDIGTNF